MIRILRNIRLSVMSDLKLRKYIFYAIGEIILVMIGILLAMQVNEWREGVRERKKEVKTLELLIRDLEEDQANIQTFKEKLKVEEDGVIKLIYHIENESHSDSILVYLGEGLGIWNYRPTYPTYEGLRQSNGLDIISDHKLRDDIINYHDDRIGYLDDFRASYKRDDQKAQLALEPYFGFNYKEGEWIRQFTSTVHDLNEDVHALNMLARAGRKRNGLIERIDQIFIAENQDLQDKLVEHLNKIEA